MTESEEDETQRRTREYDEAREEDEEDSCLGDYPDNDCDRELCLNLCEDVDECLTITRKREENGEEVIQFSCDNCDWAKSCSEPKKTVFRKPRIWSYKGACGHYGKPSHEELRDRHPERYF